MTQILTLRVPPALVAKADARAAELGLARSKYLRSLIEQDVAESARKRRQRTFASEDFIGSVPLGQGPYTNKKVRSVVEKRLAVKREKVR